MEDDAFLQNFFRVIASTRPTSRLRKDPAEFTYIQSEGLNVSDAETSESEDSDSPPTSEANSSLHSQSVSSSKNAEFSTEWMFEGRLHCQLHGDQSAVTVEELFAYIGKRFKEKYSPLAPAKINYIVVIGDSSNIEKDTAETCRLPIRGYLDAKSANRVSWQAWINQPDFTWTKVQGGMLTFPKFLEDSQKVEISNDPWSEIVHWGRRGFFETLGHAWKFECRVTLPPRNTTDCDELLEIAKTAFLHRSGNPSERPGGIKFLWAICDLFAIMDADDRTEVDLDIKGFLQTNKSKMKKWEDWLPLAEWRPMRGGLGGNKEFEDAENDVKSADSGWTELLREGTLGRNNARKLADAEKASTPFLSSPPKSCRDSQTPRQARAAKMASSSTSAASSSASSGHKAARRRKPQKQAAVVGDGAAGGAIAAAGFPIGGAAQASLAAVGGSAPAASRRRARQNKVNLSLSLSLSLSPSD